MVMEAVLLHGSLDQSISPYKSHIGTAKNIQYPLMSRPSGSFLASDFQAGMALLQAPPPPFLSRSYPPYSLQQPPQPPLLPLPTAGPHRSAGGRGLSCPPANKKPNSGNRTRDPTLTPKKSKSPTKSPKKEDKISPKKSSDCVNVVNSTTTTTPSGPDPRELAKDVRKVLPLISSSSGNVYTSKNGNNCTSNANSLSSAKGAEDHMFSGSVVFTISPPPSSLPLPTFSLRPKLSCKAEAAGIDTGATDNLRRLLRIQ
ncbi:UNVERIFIED_CONTAM: hypothetical protein Sradi_5158600 [Sesamum radiatum]|uniref:Uncharacterized protein n=1 Tax=Sesamum radiatum TaxID=300843 RepID=A0AAW2M4H4_SESRA